MLKMPQVDVPVQHFFADGVYGRQGTIPAGCVMVGRIHTQAQLNIILTGKIAVSKDGEIVTLEAPCTFVSPPGTKRVGWAITDTTWITILATGLTDATEIYDTCTVNTEEEFQHFIENKEMICLR